jgi:hypothetical protein
MSVLDLSDPEEAARRARAREAYEKMYPLSPDDPYGEKRLERVQTAAGGGCMDLKKIRKNVRSALMQLCRTVLHYLS